MTKAQFRVLMLLTVLSGLVGGGLSDWLLGGLAARAAPATAVPQVIEAQEFRVVDGGGNLRGALGSSEEGISGLVLFDAAGKPRAGLSLSPDGSPALVLYDVAGKLRTVLGLLEDGRPRLVLYDAANNLRATLSLAEDGHPGLVLLDAASKFRAALALLPDGSPGLTLWDAAGQMRAVVGCNQTVTKRTGAETKYPESTLTLSNEKGDVLWQAP